MPRRWHAMGPNKTFRHLCTLSVRNSLFMYPYLRLETLLVVDLRDSKTLPWMPSGQLWACAHLNAKTLSLLVDFIKKD